MSKSFIFLLLLVKFTFGKVENVHIGHNKPFGVGLNFLPVETRHDVPGPVEFYDKYIRASRPLILKGITKSFPSYNKLRNDTYLGEEYGRWRISCEKGKKEKRGRKPTRMSLKKFIRTYKTDELYLVTDLIKPNPLLKDIDIPKPLLCEDLINRTETCAFWLSSGGTRSVLHSDSADNLNCLYDGRKDFILASRRVIDNLNYEEGQGYNKMNVDKVDYKKYSYLLNVPWYKASLEAGDCIFIPYLWAHQINSHGPRNLAVNIFWDHMLSLPNREKCQDNNLGDSQPWNNFQIQKVLEKQRATWVMNFMKEHDPMTKDRFHDVAIAQSQLTKKDTMKAFQQIDSDKDGLISFNDLYTTNINHVKKFVREVASNERGTNPITYYEEVNEKIHKEEL